MRCCTYCTLRRSTPTFRYLLVLATATWSKTRLGYSSNARGAQNSSLHSRLRWSHCVRHPRKLARPPQTTGRRDNNLSASITTPIQLHSFSHVPIIVLGNNIALTPSREIIAQYPYRYTRFTCRIHSEKTNVLHPLQMLVILPVQPDLRSLGRPKKAVKRRTSPRSLLSLPPLARARLAPGGTVVFRTGRLFESTKARTLPTSSATSQN